MQFSFPFLLMSNSLLLTLKKSHLLSLLYDKYFNDVHSKIDGEILYVHADVYSLHEKA